MSRSKKSKKNNGWGEEYVELESETAALLQSIRKEPTMKKKSSVQQQKQQQQQQQQQRNKSRSSPRKIKKGRRKSGGGTPKGKKKEKQQRQQRRAESFDGDFDDEESVPLDSFAGLISSTVSSSFGSSNNSNDFSGKGGSSPNKKRGRRRSGSSSMNFHDTGSSGGSSQGEQEPPSSDRSSDSITPRQNEQFDEQQNSTSSEGEKKSSIEDMEQMERLRALERARAEEAKLRELSFRGEESRVREGLDGFVPHKVTQVAAAVKELDEEKSRLNKVEAAISKRGKTRMENLSNRDRRVAQMSAATDIQRIVRGKQHRKKALYKKKTKEMADDGITLLPPLHPELPGPDPTKYGPQPPNSKPTGPGAANMNMDDSNYLLDEDDQERVDNILPSLKFNKKMKRNQRPLSASSSISSMSSISSASSDLDLDEAIPVERTPRLFLPDGSPDIKLRDTVRNALRVSRFDSVSTLLASGPLARKVKNATSKMKRKGVRSGNSAAVVDKVRNMHEPYRNSQGKEAAPGGIGTKKAGFQIVTTGGNNNTAFPSPKKPPKNSGINGPPAMYEVSHGGFDIGERTEKDDVMSDTDSIASSTGSKRKKKRQVCFACWSAGDDMVKRCDMHENDDNAPDDGRDESILMCGNWNVHALRRRYRAEELQEVFAKAVSSLRWDLNRKQFVTAIECRHPIYRMINGLLETLQKRKSRMDHG
jgi:hypothetical protein